MSETHRIVPKEDLEALGVIHHQMIQAFRLRINVMWLGIFLSFCMGAVIGFAVGWSV